MNNWPEEKLCSIIFFKIAQAGSKPGIFTAIVYFISQAAPETTRLLCPHAPMFNELVIIFIFPFGQSGQGQGLHRLVEASSLTGRCRTLHRNFLKSQGQMEPDFVTSFAYWGSLDWGSLGLVNSLYKGNTIGMCKAEPVL